MSASTGATTFWRVASIRLSAAAILAAVLIAGCRGSDATRTHADPPQAMRTGHTRTEPPATTTKSQVTAYTVAHTRTATVSSSSTTAARRPLAGEVVGIDPGHNGRNYTDPRYIDHLIWNGREMEPCNTTGTETDSGYTEAEFNFNVATDLAALLRAQGARVVMTRHSNDGVGPCVNVRAHIIDRSHANVAIDIHADGGPPTGRGVAILEPVADGINNRIIDASRRFGHDVLHEMESHAHMPPSTYDGADGIDYRNDLAGLNLTTVPEVLIESGNMRNATDAALLTTTRFQRREALALDRAMRQFLGR